jgi:hypothetical protein
MYSWAILEKDWNRSRKRGGETREEKMVMETKRERVKEGKNAVLD